MLEKPTSDVHISPIMNTSQVVVKMWQIFENECKSAFIYLLLQYLVTTPYIVVLVMLQ
jgi:hypothetical protein